MSAVWLLACLPGAILWLLVLALPWRPWSTRERLEPDRRARAPDPRSVTVLVPARDEAAGIARTLSAIERHAPGTRVVVVDDRSTDGTGEVARSVDRDHVDVVTGSSLPDGWTGKLWALDQGLDRIDTELVLLLDADIELEPGVLPALLEQRRHHGADLVSVMATLETGSFWEKLLLPAFVFFFKLLYPFHLTNSSSSRVAAGAGGCMLVDTAVLREIGAFASLKSELIDDCALAARIKGAGHRIWIGLSRAVRSRRAYGGLGGIWNMVVRTAYVQLRSSPLLLAVCVVLLSWAFWLPVIGLLFGDTLARAASAVAILAMVIAYVPTLRFYRLSPLWALLLPVTGTLYLMMTIDSAVRSARGVRSSWRGRTYRTGEE